MLECDQNILSKYPLKEASLDFKTTRRQRKYMFRSRMRCDPKKKMQNGKNPQQNDLQFNIILGSSFLAIFMLGHAFSIFCQFEDVLVTI
jgi:hypothetical protein